MPRRISCGVIVTDGCRILLGHATRSPRWDIPKGLAEPGETAAATAVRELAEETGLSVPETELRPLGLHAYLRDKDLALFAWLPVTMPSPETLVCRSTFMLPGGASLPEFDRFGVFEWTEALSLVGKNLARVLAHVARPAGLTPAPAPSHARSAEPSPPRAAPRRSG
jgi:8-oxo-dGTP pyrophosphatase MutT (NUDIX family)